MNTTQRINALWDSLRDAIDQTYRTADVGNDVAGVLRDYARDISWHDDLRELLDRETANERQHRRDRPAVKDFSAKTAAQLLLMRNVVDGSEMRDCPPATDFLRYRKTVVEAQVLGWLIRANVADEWTAAVREFDYAKLMGVRP